jgi:SAM-dependent methyltransferase
MGDTKYLSVVYDEKVKPRTAYPRVFAGYVVSRFGLRDEDALLDVGCGRAEMLNAFSELGLDCCGCDLEAPPSGSSECEIKELDFGHDPFPYDADSFDVVFSKSVIEHLHDPGNFLGQIRRVLKPGGIFILLTPEWGSQWRVFYEDPTHVHPYLPLAVERLLELADFREVSVERFSHHPAIWSSSLGRRGASALRLILKTPTARRLTDITGIKYFRWAVELQILATCRK